MAVLVGARFLDQFVALLVDEQFAFGAFEALTTETPDAVVAVGAEGFLIKGFELQTKYFYY